ncbi:MAG TPA: signal peptidase II [Saprospiraceae bacterium]|nr:signal peptidase II [Saprospiraceae bacterium]HRJ13805.1 signal peptidase II [Saprospiraceae bacterium]
MKRYLLVIALLLLSVGLDRWTKLLAIEHLKDQPIQDVAGRFFQLVFVENTGAFLSFGAGFPDAVKLIVLTIMPSVLLGALLLYTLFSTQLNTWQVIAFSLISGGGISNLFDRITEGKVVDFMIMGIGALRTGVFNTADVCIMIGLFMMLPYMLGYGQPKNTA